MNVTVTMMRMDRKTLAYYSENATEVVRRYESVVSPVERYFAWPSHLAHGYSTWVADPGEIPRAY